MLLAGISIPFTYLITFAFMWLFGFEFDMVTLTGVILGVGMLLDDAIVVLENIERHYHKLGQKLEDAVVGGTQEVMLAILSGTYATVVVLVPIIWIGGFVQTVLRPLAPDAVDRADRVVPGVGHDPADPGAVHPAPRRQDGALPLGARARPLRPGQGAPPDPGVLRQDRSAWRCATRLLFIMPAVMLLVFSGRVVIPLIGRDLMPPMDTGIFRVTFESYPNTSLRADRGAAHHGREGDLAAARRHHDLEHPRLRARRALVRFRPQPAAGVRDRPPRQPLPAQGDDVGDRGEGPRPAADDPGDPLPGGVRLRRDAALDHPLDRGPDDLRARPGGARQPAPAGAAAAA